jgi:hypothetical protein
MTVSAELTRCPQCGQAVPHLTAQQLVIYNAVKRRPRTAGQLHDLLYAHQPNDGPSIKIIHVLISTANRVLRTRGLRIRSINGMYYLLGELQNA